MDINELAQERGELSREIGKLISKIEGHPLTDKYHAYLRNAKAKEEELRKKRDESEKLCRENYQQHQNNELLQQCLDAARSEYDRAHSQDTEELRANLNEVETEIGSAIKALELRQGEISQEYLAYEEAKRQESIKKQQQEWEKARQESQKAMIPHWIDMANNLPIEQIKNLSDEHIAAYPEEVQAILKKRKAMTEDIQDFEDSLAKDASASKSNIVDEGGRSTDGSGSPPEIDSARITEAEKRELEIVYGQIEGEKLSEELLKAKQEFEQELEGKEFHKNDKATGSKIIRKISDLFGSTHMPHDAKWEYAKQLFDEAGQLLANGEIEAGSQALIKAEKWSKQLIKEWNTYVADTIEGGQTAKRVSEFVRDTSFETLVWLSTQSVGGVSNSVLRKVIETGGFNTLGGFVKSATNQFGEQAYGLRNQLEISEILLDAAIDGIGGIAGMPEGKILSDRVLPEVVKRLPMPLARKIDNQLLGYLANEIPKILPTAVKEIRNQVLNGDLNKQQFIGSVASTIASHTTEASYANFTKAISEQ